MLPLLKKQVLVLCAYTLLALVLTLPVAAQLTTHVAGTGGDPWQTLWRFEHTAQELQGARQQGHLGAYLYRELLGGGEARLVNHTVWLWLPLHYLFGQPLAYNMVWLLSFILAGYCMYALVRYLLVQYLPDDIRSEAHIEAAAFIAGLVYMFLPFHAAHAYGHFGALQIQWLPLAMLLAFKFLHRPNWQTGTLLAAVTIVQAWSEHHYVVWLAIWFCLLAWIERTRTGKLWAAPASRLLLIGTVVVTGALLLVTYWPTIREAAANDNSLVLGTSQTIRFSADAFAYIIPHSFQTPWGTWFEHIFGLAAPATVSEATQFIGVLPLLLVLFFHQRLPKQQKYLWYGTVLAFFIASLGPRLKLLGYTTALPLPYAIIDGLPVFNAIRGIGRAAIMVGLSVSVLVGWILATQAKRKVNYFLAGLVVIVEFMSVPFPMQPAIRPPVYDAVRNLPGTALLDIPAATNYVAASKALYASLYHGKRVVGNIALERGQDAQAAEDSRSLPAVRQLLYVRPLALQEARAEFFEQDLAETFYDVAAWQDIRGIVIHTDSLEPAQQSAVTHFLEETLRLTPQLYADARLYQLPAGDKVSHDGVFLWRKEGFDAVNYDRERASTFVELSREGSATLVNTTPVSQNVTIEMTLAPESHGSLVMYSGATPVLEVAGQPGSTQQVLLTIPPGEIQLRLVNPLPEKLVLQNPRFTTASGESL